MKVLKKSKQVFLLFFVLFSILSCDFSPPLNKKILEAQNLISQQKYKGAISKYLEVLDRNPSLETKIKILYQVGELYSIYLNEPTKGISYFKEVLKETDDPLWQVKTEERVADISYNNIRNYKESYSSYRKLTNFRPALEKKDFYEFKMGASLFKDNQFSKAIEVLRPITKDTKNQYHSRSIFFTALAHFHLKNWKDSERMLKLFIRTGKRRDQIVEAKYILANIYETTEELKRAYDLYYSILGEYPNTKVLKNRLESIYQRKVVRKR